METDLTLYHEAANILEKANSKRASLKTLIYSSSYKNIRQLFALVNESVKYQGLLREVWYECPASLKKEHFLKDAKSELSVVLLYDCILGKNFGRNMSLRKCFMKYKQEMKGAVEKVLKHHSVDTLQDAIHKRAGSSLSKIPRYIRVNLLKSSVKLVIEMLEGEGWFYVGKLEGNKFVDAANALGESQFAGDPFLHDVLVFSCGTDLHDHQLIRAGILIQQDRASCIPAHVLKPTKGSVVLDCCAAPGNKSTHLASLMQDEGQLIALDRDAKRMQTMSTIVTRSGAKCIQQIHQDFLTVQPNSDDAAPIEMILVDPSCSGSGMLSQASSSSEKTDRNRLQTLKRFQISILKHALRFPKVEKVVYSTCSKHQEENEEVVTEVMEQVSEYFHFDHIFPEWTSSRGLASFPSAECFLRLSPETDLTQGFFVACFKRIQNKEKKTGLQDGEVVCEDAVSEEDMNVKKSKDGIKDGETDIRVLQSGEENVQAKSDSKSQIKKHKKNKEKKRKSSQCVEEDSENTVSQSKKIDKKVKKI